MAKPTKRPPLLPHPNGVAWPTAAWPVSGPASDVNGSALNELVDRGFGRNSDRDLSINLALGVVHRGHLVAQRYGRNTDDTTTLVSWSMAKSVTHTIIGFLVADGKIEIDGPAPVPEWADDERKNITIQQLLNMSSGLAFVEDYIDDKVSDVIEMLFGNGGHDVAAYARDQEPIHTPDTHFSYASGTTNILTAICGEIIGGGEAGMLAFLSERLFEPLGMSSASPRFDKAGTFIGSSYLYATTQDFLRFGYLYLRDGYWENSQLLPGGWVDHARKPVDVNVEETDWYGAHWWLPDNGLGSFAAKGYEGQRIIVVPERDLVVVRLGKTPAEKADHLDGWLKEIIECFPPEAS